MKRGAKERYALTIPVDLVLGEMRPFIATSRLLVGAPPVCVVSALCNAPCPGFVILEHASADGVRLSPFPDMSQTDAFLCATALPVSPARLARGASMQGWYTGLVPLEFRRGDRYGFRLTLVCEAA
jgi:hypothetical protein